MTEAAAGGRGRSASTRLRALRGFSPRAARVRGLAIGTLARCDGALHALHLSPADPLRMQRVDVVVASYDARMCEAARALVFSVVDGRVKNRHVAITP